MDPFKETDFPHAVIEGRVDMARWHANWTSGTFPLWDSTSLPFLYTSYAQFQRASHDPRYKEIYEKSFNDVGLVGLATYADDGNPVIWATKPIRTVEDFKGMKLRAPGLLGAHNMKALGASPVTIPGPEVPEALLRGVIDGALSDRSWARGAGIADVTTHVSRWDMVLIIPQWIAINKETFEALPPDLQGVILEVSDWHATALNLVLDFGNMYMDDALRGIGMEVVYPSETEIEKAKKILTEDYNVYEEWLKLEGVGDLGRELVEIIRSYELK